MTRLAPIEGGGGASQSVASHLPIRRIPSGEQGTLLPMTRWFWGKGVDW